MGTGAPGQRDSRTFVHAPTVGAAAGVVVPHSVVNEEWRLVPGLAPYEASSRGRIRRAGRVLAGSYDADGYRRISTSIGGIRKLVPVHTMVALAYLGPRPTPKHTVAHNDGTKLNNDESNLRWALMPEQYEDRVRHGTDTACARHPRARLTQAQVDEIRRRYRKRAPGIRGNGRRLAAEFGVPSQSIYSICANRAWVPPAVPQTDPEANACR